MRISKYLLLALLILLGASFPWLFYNELGLNIWMLVVSNTISVLVTLYFTRKHFSDSLKDSSARPILFSKRADDGDRNKQNLDRAKGPEEKSIEHDDLDYKSLPKSNELLKKLSRDTLHSRKTKSSTLDFGLEYSSKHNVRIWQRENFYNFGQSKRFGAGELYGPIAAKNLSTDNPDRILDNSADSSRHNNFVDLHLSQKFSDALAQVESPKTIEEKPNLLVIKEEQKDNVKCSVFAPEEILKDDPFLLMAFAHLPEETKDVEKTAKVFDKSLIKKAIKSLDKEVSRDSMITFFLSLDGADIDREHQTIFWRGTSTSVEFVVSVPASFKKTRLFGRLSIRENSIPIGHITFQLKVTDQNSPHTSESFAETSPKRYEYAFISYASTDRPEVVKRTQMLSRVGLKYFQDLLSLEPGELWEQGLESEIEKSDVFFLFWSKAARDSHWVEKEWKHALKANKGQPGIPPVIEPVILEGPPIVKPPLELSHLHFNDRHLYFMKPD